MNSVVLAKILDRRIGHIETLNSTDIKRLAENGIEIETDGCNEVVVVTY